MDPEQATPPEKKSKLKLVLLVSGAFLVLALLVFYVVVIRGGGNAGVGLRSLLPFGPGAGDTELTGGNAQGDKLGDVLLGEEGGGELPRMWKIADGPVSGSIWKTLPDGTLSVRYVLREDGDVYEYSLGTRSGRILANNTVPRVAEAVWDARGQSVVLRTATDQGNIVSILGKLLPNPATATGDEAPAILEQSFLPENIAFIAQAPEDGFAHTLRVGNALSIMTIDSMGKSTPVFTSPFTEWIPEWVGKDAIGLTTRPSGLVGGYFFILDPKNGQTTPIMNDYPGLTTKSAPDGTNIFVGGAKNNGLSFGIITRALPIPSSITPATLPEKCVWDPSSTVAYCGVPQNPPGALYPDEWYQGVVQFSDTLWRYERSTGQFSLFIVPQSEAGVDVDIINPSIAPDGSHMIITNKKDGSLWGVRL